MLQKTFGSTSSYIGFAKKSIWIKVEVNDESYFVHKIKDFQSLNKCYIKVCIYYLNYLHLWVFKIVHPFNKI
jgi:hypothetical protein